MKTPAVQIACGAAAVLSLVFTAPIGAGEAVTMRVSPRVAVAPATLSVDAVVEKDHANRGLQIQLVSEDYYRSSLVQLDGEDAPRTTSVRYEAVPGGTFEVRVVVLGVDGKPRASTSREIQIISVLGR
jgi:hypothetical protein